MLRQRTNSDDKEKRKLRAEIKEIIGKGSDEWLRTPNDQLGGQKPLDVLQSPEWHHLRDLIRAVQHGMPT